MVQIELNNARNVEKLLNNEITEMQKTRDKINSEYEVLKEEHCQLQIDYRKQKYVLSLFIQFEYLSKLFVL